MKVLQFLSTTAFHGAEAMTAELVRQTSALGVENHLALLDNGGASDRTLIDKLGPVLTDHCLLPCRGAFDRQTFGALNAYLHRHQIDVVHSHKYKTNFYAIPVCRASGRAIVSTYHNWIDGSFTLRAYSAIDRQLARFASVSVAVSSPVRELLARHVAPDRLLQLDNGIDVERFCPAAMREPRPEAIVDLAPRTLVIGCVGRLSEEKAPDRLLRTVAGLPREGTWCLVFIGDGPMRAALEADAAALGLADRVRFVGHQDDTARWYRAMDVFVLPSHLEAFPMALLEAMASGATVLSSRIGEIPRILDGGRCGQLVEAGASLEAWTAALAQVLGDAGLRVRLAQAARERVVREYSSRTMAERYVQAYHQALGDKLGAAAPVA